MFVHVTRTFGLHSATYATHEIYREGVSISVRSRSRNGKAFVGLVLERRVFFLSQRRIQLAPCSPKTVAVTRSSIMRDPSLVHHLGLEGEANRRKLAETFKRPTAWGKYCEEISPDGCATPDNVTVFRPPAEDGSEDGRYFVEGAYTGFFRATEKNDCNKTVNCTGHITDYPVSDDGVAVETSERCWW